MLPHHPSKRMAMHLGLNLSHELSIEEHAATTLERKVYQAIAVHVNRRPLS